MTQILRWPVTVFSQTRSAWPVPRKSAAAAIRHRIGIVGRLIANWGTPFCMIQILRWPVTVFSQTRSAWPVPRKSPVAAIFHSIGLVGRLITLAITLLFMTQMLCSPVTVFSQTSSLTVGVGGEEGVGPTANLGNALSPVMKLALIAAPEAALYLPTVPLMTVGGTVRGRPVLVMVVTNEVFATNRAGPSADNASAPGPFSPVMKLALIAAPVV